MTLDPLNNDIISSDFLLNCSLNSLSINPLSPVSLSCTIPYVSGIEACIRNFGKRNAIIVGGTGYVVFFNYQKQPLMNLDISGNNVGGILQPNEIQGMRLCYFSYGFKEFNYLKANSYFAVICLKIKYKDALNEIEKSEYFYLGWLASNNEFGGLRDWQIQLAKQWATINKKLE